MESLYFVHFADHQSIIWVCLDETQLLQNKLRVTTSLHDVMLGVAHAGKAADAAALTSVTFLVDIDSESRHRRYLKYPYGFGADVLKYADARSRRA
jgi:hypothetical protein